LRFGVYFISGFVIRRHLGREEKLKGAAERKRRTRKKKLLLLVLVIGAGLGGGNSSGSKPTSRRLGLLFLTRAELVLDCVSAFISSLVS
jgi:hypothetical protein